MRSLVWKLTLAFLLVGLTGAVLVAVLVRYRTQREFGQLVVDQNQQAMVDNLTRFYQVNKSWAGVEAIFTFNMEQNPAGHMPEPRWEARQALFVIADANGTVIFGENPNQPEAGLTQKELKKGVPIQVNDATVGWLVFAPALGKWQPGTLESDFLFNVNRAASVSALAATGIALILGGVLAYSLTRSLREMTIATERLAKGELGTQVKVRSRDELGTLAASFNQMSTELARSTELRRQMTANIAHDLRSPLSVILGYAEALNDEKLEPTPEMFAVMHTEALHLSRLIDDLKTLSLAEARELPLVFQPITPARLLQRTADAFRLQAERNQIMLQVDAPPVLPEIQVDVERMVQVLGNLMSNALRFTPAGGQISLSAEAREGQVCLRIADTGPGIPPEDLPYIFERTFRGDKARRQQEGETGLGLAIAKSLVEAQGGKISAASQLGQGTEFTLTFPVQAGDTPPVSQSES